MAATWMFIWLGVLLGAARIGGEIARKLDQPFVLGEKLFVALVIMALVTSVMVGPLMGCLSQRKRTLR